MTGSINRMIPGASIDDADPTAGTGQAGDLVAKAEAAT